MPEALYAPLLPCPFCGSKDGPTVFHDRVICGGCDAEGPALHRTLEPNLAAWNTRADATCSLRAPSATCENCGGTGEYFTHADDCKDNLCALNGDMHSCVGQVVPCDCSLRGGQQGWRPIETAPKDGSHILLYRPHITFAGFYAPNGKYWVHNAPGLPLINPEPTLWMPSPAHPASPPSIHPQETQP